MAVQWLCIAAALLVNGAAALAGGLLAEAWLARHLRSRERDAA